MQIHQLPEQQTVADTDEFALDTGTTTRRTPFLAMKTVISNFAHQLTNLTATTTVNDSDVLPIDAGSGAKKITYVNLKNKIINDAAPTYTSGDAENPSAWSSVTVITSGLSLGTLLNRVTTMIKNVRWLYSRLGTTDISGVGSTITAAISALGLTTSTTSSTVSTINTRVQWKAFTQTTQETFFAAVDDALGTGNGWFFGYINQASATAIGLRSVSHYAIGFANSANYRFIVAYASDSVRVSMTHKSNGTWNGTWRNITTTT